MLIEKRIPIDNFRCLTYKSQNSVVVFFFFKEFKALDYNVKKWESEQETYGLNVQKSQGLLIDPYFRTL